MESIREIVSFGNRMGIDSYVTVTSTAIERLLRRTGIAITRFGTSIRIVIEIAVTLTLILANKRMQLCLGKCLKWLNYRKWVYTSNLFIILSAGQPFIKRLHLCMRRPNIDAEPVTIF